MAEADIQYVTVTELCRRSRLSVATIHRLKDAGKIPFYQPAGKGGRLLFPPDAIERAGTSRSDEPLAPVTNATKKQLAGPQPAWMKDRTNPH